jgi:tetratricopeptide (TPR) repeat protein
MPAHKNNSRKTGTVIRKAKRDEHEHAHEHDHAKDNAPKVSSQLTRLESENLIRRLVEEMDPAYIFKHTLTQETVYDAMLRSKRAELHRQVAEIIEKLSPDQLEQNAAVLAMHYERGGWDDLAFVYSALAGDVAWRAYAHREALAHYNQAIAIAQRVDASLFAPRVREVFAKRGRVFEVIENRAAAIENYNAMIAYAQRAGDAAMEAEALNHLVTVQSLMGVASPDMDALLDKALKLARQVKDPQLIGRTLWNMGLSRRFSDPERATEYFKQSLELARSSNLKELVAYSLTELTVQGQIIGQWRAGEEYAREALEEFRALDNKPMIIDSLANLAELKQLRGQAAQSRKLAEEGVRISSTIENPWGILFNQSVLLTLTVDSGAFERALAEGEVYLKEARRIGFPPFIGLILVNLARANMELNHLQEAERLMDECITAFEKLGVPLWTGLAKGGKAWVQVRRGMCKEAHAILDPIWQPGHEPTELLFSFSTAGPAIGELALAEGRYDFGEAFCSWMIGLMDAQEGVRVLADTLYGRGRIYHARGDHQMAERDYERARDCAEQSQYKLLLWQIDAALAEVYAAGNKPERGRQAQERAAKHVRELADKFTTSALRESFLGRKDVQAVLQV